VTESNTNYVEYLIDLAKNGRVRSFIDLCEINLGNVFTVSFRLLSDIEEAKKVTIHTFTKSWEKLEEYNGKIPFAKWIKNIAVNYSITMLSNREDNYVEKKKPIKSLSEKELLESHIMSLPRDDRIIIILHDIEGYDNNEISNFFDGLETDEIKSKLINTREYLINKISL